MAVSRMCTHLVYTTGIFIHALTVLDIEHLTRGKPVSIQKTWYGEWIAVVLPELLTGRGLPASVLSADRPPVVPREILFAIHVRVVVRC
jgi:hypothetical protein